MTAGDGLEAADGFKLALIRASIAEGLAEDNFERAKGAGEIVADEENLSVGTGADASEERMVRNDVGEFIEEFRRFLFIGRQEALDVAGDAHCFGERL